MIAAALLGPNLKQQQLLARDWASVRKSPDVDAYVLAWIASQVRFHSPESNYNSCPIPINLELPVGLLGWWRRPRGLLERKSRSARPRNQT
jgi:hypothetical protein